MVAAAPIDASLNIASVRLAVSDLARSAAFYQQALGLPLLRRGDERALLGADPAHPALELVPIADPVPLAPRSTGLFHVAWLHPTRAGLAETVRRVAATGWPLEGASDHGVSEAVYLSDPDGLGIEIYADRPREHWQRGEGGHGVRMFTAPLDLDDLLAQGSTQPSPRISEGTGIGHVHLKVADVDKADAFYRDELGFEQMAALPSAAFLSAGGYHHHIGLNSWQSAGAPPAPHNAPGLREISFTLDGTQPRTLTDPDGNTLRFARASAD